MKRNAQLLLNWYLTHQRPLPWRRDKNPYRVWISEVMLQQTTVQAVIGYFERFLAEFPTVEALAEAPLERVLELWSGLGYYSRARMLHRAAQELAKNGFPKSHLELLELPGFGPYTARAVASISFGDCVGTVDGNAVRVLSRLKALKAESWTPKGRRQLQELADELVQDSDAGLINQAVMDLGSTICTPTKPKCVLCPWVKHCQAKAMNSPELFPLKKAKRPTEIWIWRPVVPKKNGMVGLTKNSYAPFLKNQLLWPGTAEKRRTPPKRFAFSHAITHHRIFVIPEQKMKLSKSVKLEWIPIKDLKKVAPASLVAKVLEENT